MTFMKQLRDNITEESIAYGYTLTIWGSGALLLNSFQTNPLDILLFVTGGVTGFAILALIAFKGFLKEVKMKREKDFIVSSMIHILASLGTVVVNYLIITSSSDVGQSLIYFLVGANTTFLYNLVLMAETYLSKDVSKLEEKIVGGNS